MRHKVRLAYLATHPIQYQAPMLRRIAQEPDIDLTVFFCSDLSVKRFADPGFGKMIEWDVPLLRGYRYEFLPAVGRTDRISFWKPFNYGLRKRLKAGQFDALWIHGYARWFHWVAIIMAKQMGVRVLIRDDATLISTQRSLFKRVFKSAFFLGLKAVCDGLLVTGSLNREYYLSYGIKEERTFLFPWAVDNDFFRAKGRASTKHREELRASLCLEKGRAVILYAGKMTEGKRAADLLEAYIRLSPDSRAEPHPYLLFVGDGEMREPLKRRVSKLGWNSVRFLGFKNQTELPRYYDLCDVLVLPSVYETWGLVINEVMNAGRAVIVSDRVGCGPDLIREGENGYIFKAGNTEELSRALRRVIADTDRLHTMGKKSLEIIDKWSFEEDVMGLKRALSYVLGNV